jgi:hypothetical protein
MRTLRYTVLLRSCAYEERALIFVPFRPGARQESRGADEAGAAAAGHRRAVVPGTQAG